MRWSVVVLVLCLLAGCLGKKEKAEDSKAKLIDNPDQLLSQVEQKITQEADQAKREEEAAGRRRLFLSFVSLFFFFSFFFFLSRRRDLAGPLLRCTARGTMEEALAVAGILKRAAWRPMQRCSSRRFFLFFGSFFPPSLVSLARRRLLTRLSSQKVARD